MDIGNRIKQRRISLDMTAEDLAHAVGKSRATIYRYENGDIENMPTTILEPLAQALHTTPAYLMGWDDDPEDYEILANEQGICPPNDYDGAFENWVKMKMATDKDISHEFSESVPLDRSIPIDERISHINHIYQKLNNLGKQKAYDYVIDLSEQEKYTKSDTITSIVKEPVPDYLAVQAAHNDSEIDDEELGKMQRDIEWLKKRHK